MFIFNPTWHVNFFPRDIIHIIFLWWITIVLCPTSFDFEGFSWLNLTSNWWSISCPVKLCNLRLPPHLSTFLCSTGPMVHFRLVTMVLLQTPPLFHNWIEPKHHNYTFLQTLILKPSDIWTIVQLVYTLITVTFLRSQPN